MRAINLLVFLFFTGCVISQKTNYTDGFYEIKLPITRNYYDIVLVVQDKRPYVLDGSFSPSYCGTLQALNGISYPLHTLSDKPLTDDLAILLEKALEKNSLNVELQFAKPIQEIEEIYSTSKTLNKRLLILILRDWQTDTFVNSDFIYNFNLLVINDQGKKIFEINSQAKKRIYAPGNGTPTLKEQIESVFEGVFNSPEILKAISKS
jgi:hypothetical protein